MNVGMKILLSLSFFCVLLFLFWMFLSFRKPEKKEMKIGGNTLFVEVAETSMQQTKGLSGKRKLAENEGMIFVYPYPQQPTFWMYDMKFPIDILWVNERSIIGIEKNVSPESGTPALRLRRYKAPSAITSVVEVQAGWSEKHNITQGSNVEYWGE